MTIGAYDGVHLGHRDVIAHVLELARSEGIESVIVTFDRHPASVVRPESAPQLLTDLPQKLELLEATGVDQVVVIRFDEERATETAEDFVETVLVSELAAATVVVGRDFHFGHGRAGNVALLESMGLTHDFRVVPFELVADADGDDVVSSTRIRALISAGDLLSAARLLGRPYEVRGEVVGAGAAAPGAGGGIAAGAGGDVAVGAGGDVAVGAGDDVAGGIAAGPSGDVAVAVPADILLPPSGTYAVSVGCGNALRACEVIVPAEGGSLLVDEPGESWPPGSTLRVLFDGPGTSLL